MTVSAGKHLSVADRSLPPNLAPSSHHKPQRDCRDSHRPVHLMPTSGRDRKLQQPAGPRPLRCPSTAPALHRTRHYSEAPISTNHSPAAHRVKQISLRLQAQPLSRPFCAFPLFNETPATGPRAILCSPSGSSLQSDCPLKTLPSPGLCDWTCPPRSPQTHGSPQD